jgi:DNA-binding protein H-NS
MSTIDISSLSYQELLELTTRAQDRLVSQREAHKKEVILRTFESITAAGFTVDEIFDELRKPDVLEKLSKPATAKLTKTGKPSRTLPPKYRSAEGVEWSGKGPKPAWFTAHIAAGGTPADLLINK